MKERERVDKITHADSMIFQTEKQLEELGDKLPAEHKPAIEAALGKLKEAHKAQDIAAIDAAIEELNKAFQAASAQMYQQTGGQPGPDAGFQGGQQAGPQQPGKNDDIQDADFEEVK